MNNNQLIVIVIAIIVAACIIGGAVAYTFNKPTEQVNVTANITADNNTTNITANLTEDVSQKDSSSQSKSSSGDQYVYSEQAGGYVKLGDYKGHDGKTYKRWVDSDGVIWENEPRN
ncbi:MAG: hypothetical protein HUK28_03640 [Methanobrevibacter sp.]|nr:hypothetical protein [Methanobrevibacter sp.]